MLRVLLGLIKKWITNLDNNIVAEAVLMDLSKVFDCIPNDLLIANLMPMDLRRKLYTFGTCCPDTKLLYLFTLGKWKYCVKINNINSNFETIKSGMPGN